jgi:6-pyruvoyltetrahydropterin/6-carboxytetrahydropterin synthase
MAIYLLHEVCPQLLAGTGVTATKLVIWETEESFAEASLGDAADANGATGFASAAGVRG